MNKRTFNILRELHPDLLGPALAAITEIDQNLSGRATVSLESGQRTFPAQTALYALGRTKANPDGKSTKKPLGNIVTNAKAGESIHNFRLAFDIALIIDGVKYTWDTITDFDGDGVSDWMECVRIFKKHGFEWGGDWKSFPDQPHFQMDFGYSWQQLLAKYNAGDFIIDDILNLKKPALSGNLYRVSASVNLRNGPSVIHSVLKVIIKGEQISEISRNGEWSKVLHAGITGYVSNKYLTK